MGGILRILKQRTTWVGLAGVGTGVTLCYTGSIAEGVQAIIGGLGLIFLREAVAKK